MLHTYSILNNNTPGSNFPWAIFPVRFIQRDYDEFKQPDIDGDDKISRAEFNMYVKNYLANYPGLTEKDYPKFDDFDHDGDGYVSFEEYAQQMALVASKERQKGEESTKAKALNDMAASLNSF